MPAPCPAPADVLVELQCRFDEAVDRLLTATALVDVNVEELNIMLWQMMRGAAADFADELVVRRHQAPPRRAAVVQMVLESCAAAQDRRAAMREGAGHG